MQIETWSIDDVIPYENNPRKNDKAVQAVVNSIREFGWQQPLVVNSEGVIVVGHTRLKAAIELGLTEVPVVVADNLTEDQVKAYRLADNKVGELATWDWDLLEDELFDIDMDMEFFGFKDLTKTTTAKDHTDNGGEIDIDDFAEDKFKHECPRCGFRFN